MEQLSAQQNGTTWANRRRVRSSPGAPTDAADSSAVAAGNSAVAGGRNKKARKTVDLGWSSSKKQQKDGRHNHLDDLIDSSSDEDNDQQARLDQEDDDEEEEETLYAKKIRLARQYLEKLESDDDDESSGDDDDDDDDGEDLDKDRLGRKLQRKRMKRQGTLEYVVAKRIVQDFNAMHLPDITTATTTATTAAVANNETEILQQAKAWHDAGRIQYFRGHDLTPTCVALQQITGEKAISGSKDHSVWWWDVETGQKISQLCPPWKHHPHQQQQQHKHSATATATSADSRNAGQVLAVACSDDGRYAAVGKRDATVTIFDVRIASKQNHASVVTTFTGHKGPVTCLTFRTQSRQLFSGSDDRCIRHYNLDEMLYVETLYGHQFGVTAMDCHRQELPVSVGRDRTARVWKLAEDSHLIFRAGAKVASAEAVSVIQDDWFLTGHEDGHLALWMSGRKRPVTCIDHAHGLRRINHGSNNDAITTLEHATTTVAADTMFGNGIASLAALKNSDVAATGSNDGYLRLWKVATGKTLAERGMEPLAKIPVHGYINGVAIGPKAKFCVVAVGQEPRLGRWNRIPKAKNRFGIIQLRAPQDGQDDDVDEETADRPKSTTVTALRKAKQTKEDCSFNDDMSAES